MPALSDQGPLHIYGNPDLEKVNPSFKANINNNTCKVNLALQEFKSTGIGDGIYFAMLGSPTPENNLWKILFDQEKIYSLDLNYGFGNADVDLSGVSVNALKIRSGSADVVVDYSSREMNKVTMDTFMIRVDMGSLHARNIHCSNTDKVIAHVGFGNAELDFSNPLQKRCNVEASVGAGSLDIYLPQSNAPVIIYMKDSPFCGVKLLKGFEQVEKGVFVNMDYSATAPNLLTFHLDVAMGNVAFHYQ